MIKTKPDLTDEVIRDQSSLCSIPYCVKIKTERKRKVDKDWECLIIPPGIQFIQLVVTVVVCGQQVKPKLSEVCTYTVLSNILNQLEKRVFTSVCHHLRTFGWSSRVWTILGATPIIDLRFLLVFYQFLPPKGV